MNIDSGNGLSPVQRQANICTNDDLYWSPPPPPPPPPTMRNLRKMWKLNLVQENTFENVNVFYANSQPFSRLFHVFRAHLNRRNHDLKNMQQYHSYFAKIVEICY